MNNEKVLPIMYYPTTIVCVDDNINYLKSIDLVLQLQKGLTTKLFTNPEEASEFLNKYKKTEEWLNSFISVLDDNESSPPGSVIKLDIAKIVKRIYDDKRFEDVSTIFSDYKMPEKIGTDFFNSVKNAYYNRIMLSGVMPPSETLIAFNDRTFNKYINKADKKVHELIVQYTKESQEAYFANVTPEIVKQDPKLASTLANEQYYELIKSLLNEHKFVEFYLLDNNGSYLFLDADANAKILAVQHEEDIEGYLDFLSYEDDVPDKDMLNALKNRSKFPYFYNMDEPPVANWKDYLVDAKHLPGTKIYYSLIDDLKKFDLQLDNIKPFTQYKKENKATN